ncbi:hypothetical protein [Prescottella equi]|uniref:hypothetical protein n=1 Tax=Rhodococcus hoagii TaxID=43767 RepID=UPI0007CD46FF|nr:hypothetical protein [Prescottella equi]
MSQDLVRERRGIHSGPVTHVQQTETALAAAVHENNELRAENARLQAADARARSLAAYWKQRAGDAPRFAAALTRTLDGDH